MLKLQFYGMHHILLLFSKEHLLKTIFKQILIYVHTSILTLALLLRNTIYYFTCLFKNLLIFRQKKSIFPLTYQAFSIFTFSLQRAIIPLRNRLFFLNLF